MTKGDPRTAVHGYRRRPPMLVWRSASSSSMGGDQSATTHGGSATTAAAPALMIVVIPSSSSCSAPTTTASSSSSRSSSSTLTPSTSIGFWSPQSRISLRRLLCGWRRLSGNRIIGAHFLETIRYLETSLPLNTSCDLEGTRSKKLSKAKRALVAVALTWKWKIQKRSVSLKRRGAVLHRHFPSLGLLAAVVTNPGFDSIER